MMEFTQKSAEYLVRFYVNIRKKQSKNYNHKIELSDKPFFSPRDLKNVKKLAIEICRKRKGKQVSIGDVKKALKKHKS